MKTWSAAEAKRRFSELIHEAAIDPQVLLLRGKPVGVVVSYESFALTQAVVGEKSLSMWLEELTPLNETEGDVESPSRTDRADQFGEGWK
jgi:prevent-host-death family protein